MTDDIVPLKQCIRCKQSYPKTTEHFQPIKTKDGFKALCRICARDDYKKYRDTHKEQRSASFKDWRNRHRESEIKRGKQWRLDHPEYARQWYIDHAEKQREQGAQWRADHPLWVQQRGKKYRENHPQHHKLWRAENKDKIRIVNARRKTRKLTLPNTLTPEEWRQTLNHFNGCCAICGRPPGLWHTIAIDHWIPLKADIPDNPGTVVWNVIPLCHGVDGCNNEKSAKMPDVWLKQKYGQRKAKAILDRIQEYLNGRRDR